MVGPLSTGMSQCATAPCNVSTGEVRCTCAGYVDQMLIGHKAEVIVAVRNLLCPTGIDDIDLRGDLITRAQPGLADDGEGVVGVVVGEHLRGRAARASARRSRSGRWRRACRSGRRAASPAARCASMIVKNASLARSTTPAIECVLEHHHAGPVGQRPDQLGLQRPAVGGSDASPPSRPVRCFAHRWRAGSRRDRWRAAPVRGNRRGAGRPRRSTPCVLRERQRSCR